MSSHHIIRENQEPALVIMSQIDMTLLGELCEWSPRIYVHSGLLNWITETGIKVDVIFGEDSGDELVRDFMEFQKPLEFIHVEGLDKLLPLITNDTIHLVSSAEENGLALNANKNIVRYSDSYKEYVASGFWKKWKNKGDYLEILNSTNPEITNLNRSETGFLVEKDGMTIVFSTTSFLIREFF